MSTFETQVLPATVLLGLIFTICYGYYLERRAVLVRVRKMALGEAAAAIQSLAAVAEATCAQRRRDGQPYEETDRRAYYYDRAASIVRSIPVDRL